MTSSKKFPHSLENQFLVSMPQLDDPNFRQSVILICKHDAQGALGIVINRLSGHLIGDIFIQLGIDVSSDQFSRQPVMDGGPVFPEFGLIVHDTDPQSWESSIIVGDSLWLTSSREILDDMAQGKGPERAVMSLGYAGWAPDQLENEIHENAWFTTPVDREILFAADVDDKWHQSAKLLGIDTNKFSSQVGHA
jgi:putative transcriptional regulator